MRVRGAGRLRSSWLPDRGDEVRAVVLGRPADGPAVQVREVSEPGAPRGSQLLLRVLSSSINGSDLNLVSSRRLRLALSVAPRPLVLGFDVCGVVEACGPRVTAFEVGERVAALLPHSGGGQADYVLIDQHRAARVPGVVSPLQAAGLPLAGLTAMQALFGVAELPAMVTGGRVPRVLIVGAAGGIGSFGVQLARYAGAVVTAITDRQRTSYVRQLGADEVRAGSPLEVLDEGRTWDVILDTPGRLPAHLVRGALSLNGVHVSTHPLSRDALRGVLRVVGGRRGPHFAAVRTSASSQDLSRLLRMVARNDLAVPLHAAFAVDEAAAAYRRASRGGVQGKIVLTLYPDQPWPDH